MELAAYGAPESALARVKRQTDWRQFFLISVGYVIAFMLLDWVSFIHPFAPFGIKPWDPPTALTLAVLFRLGLRYAVIVPFAVFLSDVFVRGMPGTSVLTLMSAVIITTVHIAAASTLRHSLRVDPGLTRLTDLSRFVLVSLAATLLLALAVVVQFFAAGLLETEDFWAAALRSWVGDFIAILALTPALLVFTDPRRTWTARKLDFSQLRLFGEACGHGAMIVATVAFVFGATGIDAFKFFYLLFLPIIWVAVRHGLEGAAAGILVTEAALIVAVQDEGYEATTLIEFQMLMLALCLTGLFIGAIVSERRVASQALRDSEARLKAILATAPDAIMTVDELGLIQSTNPVVERLFRMSSKELIGTPITSLLPQLKLRASDQLVEMHGYRRDGSYFPAEVAVGETPMAYRRLYIAIIRDVTRRAEAEAWVHQHQLELAHADRVSLVGEMASAIAHEESQPLAAIAAYSRACLLMLKAPTVDLDKVRASLEKVSAQAARAGEILTRLREFLLRGEMQVSTIAVADLVNAVSELARTDMSVKRIELELQVSPGLPDVMADAVHTEQVLLNLVRNAVDAITDHDCLDRRVVLAASRRDERIEFSVRDSGPGIDPAILDRLFQPFTTTKQKGMGLGLSISRTIVEAHGGQLSYRRNPEGGTTFFFDLPIAAA